MEIPAPKLEGPKRQHYLPRMYLKGFASDGGVAVFDRHTGELRRQTIGNTAVEGHIYTFEDAQGRPRYEIEEMLSQIESGLSDAIPRLEQGKGYTGDDIDYLRSFIAFAELRTPSALKDAKRVHAGFADTLGYAITASVERAMSALAAMYRDKGENRSREELKKEAEDLVRFVREGNYRIEVDHQAALMQCLRLWKPVVDSLLRKDLKIVVPTDPQSRYITCDSPVVLESASGSDTIGFGSDDAIVLFPLTPRCLVVFSGSQGRIGTGSAQSEQVDRVNELLALSAERYVIGGDEALLGSLAGRLRLGKTKRNAKYVTERVMTGDGAIGAVKRTFPHRERPMSLDPEADPE
ncbi:DUF4238 domain-containing protein [Burkholderia ubonensis]|uniref:DUF4238 domain-containing protein n=1 Tax=Burkholderia ubonensis TaxID=101571 RepID=UPI0009B48B0D|nr:DUF4238 domain-containing protein [Burkholderia ubonensis]